MHLTRIRRLRLPLAIAAVTALAAVTACSGSVTSGPHAPASQAPPTYYLALGDSLSQGVQPDAAGASVETRYGYADQLYAALRPGHPTLELVKLGCPGETTSTMINGGICHYPDGSQLKAAVAFLHAYRGRVLLVTIDIGANDPEHCGSQTSLTQLASCATTGIPAAVTHLTTIMAALKAAAGPGVRIVGMNYYLPALAEWRDGLPGTWSPGPPNGWPPPTTTCWIASTPRPAPGSPTCSAPSTPPTSPSRERHRATSPCYASGPGRARLRPAGLTSTPTRPAIRSWPGHSCKLPACTDIGAERAGRHAPAPARARARIWNASLDTATPATEAGNCDSGRTLICGGPAWAQARPSASFPAER